MQTRQMGERGPAVSVIGLGCNNFGMRIDAGETASVVHAALEAGITHFDTAEMYGGGRSEEFLGKALGAHRDQVVIATKYLRRPDGEPYTPGILRRRILEGCETSLRRLGTDRIDLYYQHFPDPEGPVDEVLETFDQLVADGKVLAVASSNVDGVQIDEAAEVSAARGLVGFCATQAEWSLVHRGIEQSTLPAARRHHMGVVPYYPLASGLLTGKYHKGQAYPPGTRFAAMERFAKHASDQNYDYVAELSRFAAERGHSVTELALAWLVAHEEVCSVIAGATNPDQVAANARAAEWVLTAADLAALPAPPAPAA